MAALPKFTSFRLVSTVGTICLTPFTLLFEERPEAGLAANAEEAANATLNTATVFTSFIIHSKIKIYKINELSQEESESNLQIRPLGKVR